MSLRFLIYPGKGPPLSHAEAALCVKKKEENPQPAEVRGPQRRGLMSLREWSGCPGSLRGRWPHTVGLSLPPLGAVPPGPASSPRSRSCETLKGSQRRLTIITDRIKRNPELFCRALVLVGYRTPVPSHCPQTLTLRVRTPVGREASSGHTATVSPNPQPSTTPSLLRAGPSVAPAFRYLSRIPLPTARAGAVPQEHGQAP